MKVKGLNDWSLFAIITKDKSAGNLFVDENSINKDFWGVKLDCSNGDNGDIGFGDICNIDNDCPGYFWRRIWHDILRIGKDKVLFSGEKFFISVDKTTLLAFIKNKDIDFIVRNIRSPEDVSFFSYPGEDYKYTNDKEIIDKSYFENIPKVRLIGNNLLVRQIKKQEYKLESGIIIPDYFRTQSTVGFIVNKSRNVDKVDIGDKVIWGENCGQSYGDDFILSQNQLLGVIIE